MKLNHIILTAIFLIFPTIAAAKDNQSYTVEEIEFVSHGIQLSGSVVFPKNGKFHSAVIFVHGSGKQTRNLFLAKSFAAKGIAALVYDKRGAGRSGGEYESKQSVSEKNINLLAGDAAAAFKALRQHSKTKDLPLGMTGISQAGWKHTHPPFNPKA